MLIVAPIGSTNDETRFETPTFCSTARIVTGSVAADEDVENAIASGSAMLRKWTHGRIRPSSRSSSGSTRNRCVASPPATVSAYQPSARNASPPVLATALTIRPKTPNGASRMMPLVSTIIAWKPASKTPSRRPRGSSGSRPSATPSRIENTIRPRMSPLAAAASGFVGTMRSSMSATEAGVSISGSGPSPTPASSAPTPGRIALANTRPTRIASVLVAR